MSANHPEPQNNSISDAPPPRQRLLLSCLLVTVLLSRHDVTGFVTTDAPRRRRAGVSSPLLQKKKSKNLMRLHQALPQHDDYSSILSMTTEDALLGGGKKSSSRSTAAAATAMSRASSIALFALRLPSEFPAVSGSSSLSSRINGGGGGVMDIALPQPAAAQRAGGAVWVPPELGPSPPAEEPSIAVQQQLQRVQESDSSSSGSNIPLWQLALAGSLATAIGDMAVHPMDSIKTVMQSDMAWQLGLAAANGKDISFWQTVQYIWQTAGWTGFYHGFGTYAAMDAAGGAIKFAVWEVWKSRILGGGNSSESNQNNNNLALLMLGAGLSFLASSSLIVPGELIKQQLQMEQYSSLAEALQGIWTTSGLTGFFTGYSGVVYRELPYTMLELGLYEVLKKQKWAWFGKDTSSSSSDCSVDGDDSSPSSPPPAWQNMAVAAGTGGFAAFLTTPMDVVKTKLMVDAAYAQASFWDTMVSTWSQHGWPALFCGVEARVSWIMPFVCIYLPLYDFIKDQLEKLQQQEGQRKEEEEGQRQWRLQRQEE